MLPNAAASGYGLFVLPCTYYVIKMKVENVNYMQLPGSGNIDSLIQWKQYEAKGSTHINQTLARGPNLVRRVIDFGLRSQI